MFAISAQYKLKVFGVVLAVPLSLFLTVIAALDLPPVRASHHTAALPLAPDNPFARLKAQPALADPTAPANGGDVSIVDFDFSPSVITITAGTIVTWTNLGSFAHTTTSDFGSPEVWDSGNLDPGNVFSRTFPAHGVFTYACAIHPSMRGTVAVMTQVYLPQVLR